MFQIEQIWWNTSGMYQSYLQKSAKFSNFLSLCPIIDNTIIYMYIWKCKRA